ncbi:bifunctional adenosylcobinamide kinase/adenosylcobinamide-phosphate guanylyltransferase [Shewanella sp. UCD-KL12]|uniref:bifunctional adenosylcobinamide kinase/adenosylcobinamide-phosphate guanylyltransferase n=1 Tax=Shewanella sp. UCD-KL12 TaxID=1917163 RepID=UPI000970DA61|nr:bifunctional adenosylcobinamide kinase/adenosylcobinamide-phosphate guanylyltransferase [Shewanella sp. UCD-KL12]
MIHLILGGARSGKTRHGMTEAKNGHDRGLECVYIATAQALDDEMGERIARHRNDRDLDSIDWLTVETPLRLVEQLREYAREDRAIVVDCLTLWLTNHLVLENSPTVFSGPEHQWAKEKQDLLNALPSLAGEIYLVSNEVGGGIVPLGELNRRFVDEAGWLHQDIAAIADTVTLVTAGIPVKIKG